MAKIILACRQKPLAAFIENVFADLSVECRLVDDIAALTVAAAEFQPDIILINSGFPTPAKNSVLLADLKGSGLGIPVLSLCEPVETMLTDEGGERVPEKPDLLLLPFSEKDLRAKIENLTGLELAGKAGPETDLAEAAALPSEDLQQKLQPEESEGEIMDKVEADSVKIIELTEIVEEGLPLDELLGRVADSSPMAGPDTVETAVDSADEPSVSQDVSEIAPDDADLDFDDFGDSLDDLEADLSAPAAAAAAPIVETVLEDENEPTTIPEVALEPEPVVKDAVTAAADMEFSPDPEPTVSDSVSTVSAPVAGDLDDLLDDADFTEVEILEEEDPVLAGLKSAGLTPEKEVTKAAADAHLEKENAAVTDDLHDCEDLLAGVAAVQDEADLESSVAEKATLDVDDAAEFVEMPRPEEVAVTELISGEEPPAVAAVTAAGEQDDLPEIELPEDYIEDEELMSEALESEPEVESQSEDKSSSVDSETPSRVAATPSPAEPRVFTEPQSLDFSQQIEGMTQEWSKQLLQTTYASMDKMIKAIGDLAPTIVNQVAREVIPPLAEKVIKAEIARLEEQLKLEEGEANPDDPLL